MKILAELIQSITSIAINLFYFQIIFIDVQLIYNVLVSSVHKVNQLSVQFSSVQLLSHVQLFATPWTVACQATLFITNSQSLLKLTSIKSVMLYNRLIFCHPLLLLPSIPPSIRIFFNESTLRMRQPKYWSFSFSISPSKSDAGYSMLGAGAWG